MKPIQSDSFPVFVDGRIEKALGKPWIALGKDLKGFDCWGFVRYALDLQEAPEAPFFEEDSRPCKIKELSKTFTRVTDKTPYSIIVLGTRKHFHHVGVYHPANTVYHCIERGGVCGHRFDRLGMLGFDCFEYYKWGGL